MNMSYKGILTITKNHIKFDDELSYNFEWLRENCRCESCYNSVTSQRNILIFDIDPDIHPRTYSVLGNTLNIEWSDSHCSQYDLIWLRSQAGLERRPQVVLWSGDTSSEVEHVSATDVKTDQGARRLVQSILQYGVGFITGVRPDLEATKEAIQCVGPPIQTLFGGMWQFSDQMDHLDTAYTNLSLEPHTDTTYFTEPAGLIIFHCTERRCEGGQTLLVDGFQAAKEVQTEDSDLYESLRKVHTEFQYLEKDYNLRSMSPMIRHSSRGDISQIRYNIYDRSARLPFPACETGVFYRAVRRLARAVGRTDSHWWLTLTPGTVAFINNWRVLHGRSQFTGHRTITGAYMAMGSLLSRARCLGNIR